MKKYSYNIINDVYNWMISRKKYRSKNLERKITSDTSWRYDNF